MAKLWDHLTVMPMGERMKVLKLMSEDADWHTCFQHVYLQKFVLWSKQAMLGHRPLRGHYRDVMVTVKRIQLYPQTHGVYWEKLEGEKEVNKSYK